MTVRAEISEADIVHVRPGQAVTFTILGDPDHRYEATLGSIEQAPESITGDSSISTTSASSAGGASSTSEAIYYIGTFALATRDGRLRTYMTTEVKIVLQAAKDELPITTAGLVLAAEHRGRAETARCLKSW